MKSSYDKYYQTENLFGDPYPELLQFMADYPIKEKVLDVGCGQGRNAIALARLGYQVTGIDNSTLGISQMNQAAQAGKLNVLGEVEDIYTFNRFEEFDIILLDSMFHFHKKDRQKEVGLIQKIFAQMKIGSIAIVCIQDMGNKLQILEQTVDNDKTIAQLANEKFTYSFKNQQSGHQSESAYRMLILKKT